MPSKTDIIEALLFAADRPVSLAKLAEIAELTPEEAEAELEALRAEKTGIGALQLMQVAGGFQFVTKPQYASYIRRLREEKRQKLSRAAFEVLAIVAYRQPATRSDIDGLRGVESAGPLQFLLEKKLVTLAGRKEVPGRPWLYRTTHQFLDQFGLSSLEDLPDLEEFAVLETGTHQQTLNLFERASVSSVVETNEPVAEDFSEDTATLTIEFDSDDPTAAPESPEAETQEPTMPEQENAEAQEPHEAGETAGTDELAE